jgi:hypothetical protein
MRGAYSARRLLTHQDVFFILVKIVEQLPQEMAERQAILRIIKIVVELMVTCERAKRYEFF